MKKINQIFPLVSIVVTTKNEEENIDRCLQSIKDQTYPNIEIIVVDNGSNDKTKEISRNYTKKVYNKGPERSAQRNYGMIDKAKGEYVMFVDADMILEPHLISQCVGTIQQTNVSALHITEVVIGNSFFSKVRRFERSFYNGSVIDGARFFRKDMFVKIGGFDTSMSGPEDWDIDKKLKQGGREIYLISNSYIYHNEGDFNLKSYLDKKAYYSKSFDKYKEKWGADDEDVKKQLGFYYRFIGVFTEKGKWKKLLRHPILTTGMYYLRFRVGLRYLRRNRNAS